MSKLRIYLTTTLELLEKERAIIITGTRYITRIFKDPPTKLNSENLNSTEGVNNRLKEYNTFPTTTINDESKNNLNIFLEKWLSLPDWGNIRFIIVKYNIPKLKYTIKLSENLP